MSAGAPAAARLPRELGRAFAGALIFGLPMLMTMEMWWLGFYMAPPRLALLLLLVLPLLVKLSRYAGFRRTARLRDDVADALVAVAIAGPTAFLVLALFGAIDADMSLREILGKVALQAVPGSIGAMLARSQLGGGRRRETEATYAGELFLMVAGALFLSLNVAPTEEVVLIAHTMSAWQEVGLLLLTLLLMHAFVFLLEFGGTERAAPGAGFWTVFARFTVVGYAMVLLVSLFVLWTFGRVDGMHPEEVLSAAVVLGFPGGVGAAVARLIL